MIKRVTFPNISLLMLDSVVFWLWVNFGVFKNFTYVTQNYKIWSAKFVKCRYSIGTNWKKHLSVLQFISAHKNESNKLPKLPVNLFKSSWTTVAYLGNIIFKWKEIPNEYGGLMVYNWGIWKLFLHHYMHIEGSFKKKNLK